MKAWFLTTALVAHSGRRARKRPARAELPLGASGEFGGRLGLDNRWAFNAVRAVGNHGEVFERDVGGGGPPKLHRGLSGLWAGGGLMYAILFR